MKKKNNTKTMTLPQLVDRETAPKSWSTKKIKAENVKRFNNANIAAKELAEKITGPFEQMFEDETYGSLIQEKIVDAIANRKLSDTEAIKQYLRLTKNTATGIAAYQIAINALIALEEKESEFPSLVKNNFMQLQSTAKDNPMHSEKMHRAVSVGLESILPGEEFKGVSHYITLGFKEIVFDEKGILKSKYSNPNKRVLKTEKKIKDKKSETETISEAEVEITCEIGSGLKKDYLPLCAAITGYLRTVIANNQIGHKESGVRKSSSRKATQSNKASTAYISLDKLLFHIKRLEAENSTAYNKCTIKATEPGIDKELPCLKNSLSFDLALTPVTEVSDSTAALYFDAKRFRSKLETFSRDYKKMIKKQEEPEGGYTETTHAIVELEDGYGADHVISPKDAREFANLYYRHITSDQSSIAKVKSDDAKLRNTADLELIATESFKEAYCDKKGLKIETKTSYGAKIPRTTMKGIITITRGEERKEQTQEYSIMKQIAYEVDESGNKTDVVKLEKIFVGLDDVYKIVNYILEKSITPGLQLKMNVLMPEQASEGTKIKA